MIVGVNPSIYFIFNRESSVVEDGCFSWAEGRYVSYAVIGAVHVDKASQCVPSRLLLVLIAFRRCIYIFSFFRNADEAIIPLQRPRCLALQEAASWHDVYASVRFAAISGVDGVSASAFQQTA